jgi:hypothetical protein
VANFYARVFAATQSTAIREMLLVRLPRLGYQHNRWHVGRVFAKLVEQVTDPTLVLTVRDVLREDPRMARWCSDELRKYSLPRSIRDVLDEAAEAVRRSDDENPFYE